MRALRADEESDDHGHPEKEENDQRRQENERQAALIGRTGGHGRRRVGSLIRRPLRRA
jgi:hypothetical protein